MHICSCCGRVTPFGTERRCSLLWQIHKMRKLVFRNRIYTVLRPLYYLCKVFVLVSYSYVADRRKKRITTDYGYLNYMFIVTCLIVYTTGLSVQIITLHSYDFVSQNLFIAFILQHYFIIRKQYCGCGMHINYQKKVFRVN